MAAGRIGVLAAALVVPGLTACNDDCCSVDGFPVPLLAGPDGELMVRVATETGPQPALLDPGSPLTFWHRPGPPEVQRRDLRLVGPVTGSHPAPLRALFKDVQLVANQLGGIGDPEIPPAAILGADLLGGYAVEIGFAARELTFWRRSSANEGFLGAAGYAVLRLPRRGGGQLPITKPRDWLGRREPLEVPPSRLLMRACAAPAAWTPEEPLPPEKTCNAGEVKKLATGTDLSLLLSTGVGPLVLGRLAWERVRAGLGETPPLVDRPLRVAYSSGPVPAQWTTIPRLALVDREADLVADPGPCAELGRARRTEQVARLQVACPAHARCALPCDREPRGALAENSAAHLDLEGRIEVAVIDDATPFLQGLRAEIRPQGPEVDGLIGARALAPARLEIDYFNTEPRAIFSCEPGYPDDPLPANAIVCRSSGRCPRLPDGTQSHHCFGLKAHSLPKICDTETRPCVDPSAPTAPMTVP